MAEKTDIALRTKRPQLTSCAYWARRKMPTELNPTVLQCGSDERGLPKLTDRKLYKDKGGKSTDVSLQFPEMGVDVPGRRQRMGCGEGSLENTHVFIKGRPTK